MLVSASIFFADYARKTTDYARMDNGQNKYVIIISGKTDCVANYEKVKSKFKREEKELWRRIKMLRFCCL